MTFSSTLLRLKRFIQSIKKPAALALSVLMFTLFCASVSAQSNAQVKNLTVGTAADYHPVAFMHEGEFSGIEADFVRILSKQLGSALDVKVMPWKQLIPALESGEIDIIMSGMSASDARAQRIDFTRPYLRIGQMAIIRTADVARFSHPMKVLQPGVKIGYEDDTTGSDFVTSYAGLTDTVPFPSAEAGLKALQSGEIDAFVHDAPTSWELAQPDTPYGDLLSLYRPLTEEYLAWGVNKNNPALVERLNKELQQMKRTGMLDHVLNRWVPVQVEVN